MTRRAADTRRGVAASWRRRVAAASWRRHRARRRCRRLRQQRSLAAAATPTRRRRRRLRRLLVRRKEKKSRRRRPTLPIGRCDERERTATARSAREIGERVCLSALKTRVAPSASSPHAPPANKCGARARAPPPSPPPPPPHVGGDQQQPTGGARARVYAQLLSPHSSRQSAAKASRGPTFYARQLHGDDCNAQLLKTFIRCQTPEIDRTRNDNKKK